MYLWSCHSGKLNFKIFSVQGEEKEKEDSTEGQRKKPQILGKEMEKKRRMECDQKGRRGKRQREVTDRSDVVVEEQSECNKCNFHDQFN